MAHDITAAYTTEDALVVDTGIVPAGATPWLVKFHSTEDTEYLSAIEATYLQMAAAAGITTCNHRLVRLVTGDTRDVTELVRRAVFNVIAHNREDLHGLARPADVSTAEIDEMVNTTLEVVASWPSLAEASCASGGEDDLAVVGLPLRACGGRVGGSVHVRNPVR